MGGPTEKRSDGATFGTKLPAPMQCGNALCEHRRLQTFDTATGSHVSGVGSTLEARGRVPPRS
jgi:hypothetical protein